MAMQNEPFLSKVNKQWQSEDSLRKFIEQANPDRYVGDLINLEFGYANILIHDYHKRVVGGIPHGCLLIATRITPEETTMCAPDDERMSLILLRVMGSIPLRSDLDMEKARLEAVKRANDTPQNYDEAQHTDQFTLDLLRYAGAKCRILGTFRMYQDSASREWSMHFGGDIDNFYAGQGMKVYKPGGDALNRIVNFRGADDSKAVPTEIGRLRYSAAVKESDTPESVPVEITADDMIAQRTALFGVTRSGKSNTTKMIAAAIYKLREGGGQRVGQLIFDPNGEYANDNPQDQGCLRNIQYAVAGTEGDVRTYGSYRHPYDPERNITKFNFYGSQEPFSTDDQAQIKASLETLYQGKRIIDDALKEESGGYVAAFTNADISGGIDKPDHREYKRIRRRVFFYRAILAEAGFDQPEWSARAKELFNENLRNLMKKEPKLEQYVDLLDDLKGMRWDVAKEFSKAFAAWVNSDEFQNYDRNYARQKKDGRSWSDPELLNLLRIYDNTRGISIMQKTRDWHDLTSSDDYADSIVAAVRAGKLVIVDQMLGDPDMNRQAAERIARGILAQQQRSFSQPNIDKRTGEIEKPPPVIIYAEEAHTLLPESSENDNANIWARLAKEGAKFNIGMVYSTQEPSALQRNILTNTENWFIAHLSSTDETNQIKKYKDFGDFTESIINVSEPGYLKVRTRSRHYTIPVQMNLFEASPPVQNNDQHGTVARQMQIL